MEIKIYQTLRDRKDAPQMALQKDIGKNEKELVWEKEKFV